MKTTFVVALFALGTLSLVAGTFTRWDTALEYYKCQGPCQLSSDQEHASYIKDVTNKYSDFKCLPMQPVVPNIIDEVCTLTEIPDCNWMVETCDKYGSYKYP